MSELVKLYNKERKKQRQALSEEMATLTVKIPVKVLKAIDNIAAADGNTRSAFVRYALISMIKRWKPGLANKHAWPACRHCGEHHDPTTHGFDEF
jgi:predicted transcriptional regulator